eukprot:12733-Heterococcus_DN1.PRE.11
MSIPLISQQSVISVYCRTWHHPLYPLQCPLHWAYTAAAVAAAADTVRTAAVAAAAAAAVDAAAPAVRAAVTSCTPRTSCTQRSPTPAGVTKTVLRALQKPLCCMAVTALVSDASRYA